MDSISLQQVGRRPQSWWDRYFLDVAQAISAASKDPSTKVGAVITRPDKTMASFGYNGFPRGIADTEERLNDRDTKIAMVIHGEINAILTAHHGSIDHLSLIQQHRRDTCVLSFA